MKLFEVFFLAFFSTNLIVAQQSEIQKLASENVTTFNTTSNNSFTGKGWERLLKVSKESNSVLIGEDHFTNEIPYFINALSSEIHFDNFICEIDPFLAKTLENKVGKLNDKELNEFVKNYGDNFSFFELKPEFELLQKLIKSKTNIIGLDQISLVADRVTISELKKRTENEKAKSIYSVMEETSKKNSSVIYMFTDDFQNKLDELLTLDLSTTEIEQLKALKLSRDIYLESNHHLRIQWMKNRLLRELPNWNNKKNLFNFGALHMPSGESLLEIYDIGNFVNNIEDSEFRKSLHILIVGKSGYSGTPDKSNPTYLIDENSENLKIYIPFFNLVEDQQWYSFDLSSLKKAISENKNIVEDITLLRIIKGFDYLVVVPTITPAKFIEAD